MQYILTQEEMDQLVPKSQLEDQKAVLKEARRVIIALHKEMCKAYLNSVDNDYNRIHKELESWQFYPIPCWDDKEDSDCGYCDTCPLGGVDRNPISVKPYAIAKKLCGSDEGDRRFSK